MIVKPITANEHRQYLQTLRNTPDTSFLQLPEWGLVKKGWRSESIGWFDGKTLCGVGLILYRKVPKLNFYLAYLPEGPVLDWTSPRVPAMLDALVAYAKSQKSFALRIGPTIIHRRWSAPTVKAAISDPNISLLSQQTPDEINEHAERLIQHLNQTGWIAPNSSSAHFSSGQPMFNFQLPLADENEETILKGMNQLWRRNIKKAAKCGVSVRYGQRTDLSLFHSIYLETAQRDGFTPRPLEYFEHMWDCLNAHSDTMRVYLAEYEGDTIAATTWIHVNGHCWYSYGASTTAHRDVRGSNAIQWKMIQDSMAVGASVYDLRGITQGLTADDPELGLIQFKVGTGGEATAFIGEWDFPIRTTLYKLFHYYMKRR